VDAGRGPDPSVHVKLAGWQADTDSEFELVCLLTDVSNWDSRPLGDIHVGVERSNAKRTQGSQQFDFDSHWAVVSFDHQPL